MSGGAKLAAAAGGSVTMVVDDTLTTDETFNVSDGGIESGSNANGSYTKFPDGTLICNGVVTVGATLTSKGALYTSETMTTWTFPFSFIAAPTFSYTTGATSYTWLLTQITQGNYALIRPWRSATASSEFTFNVTAIGRWK